MERFKVVDAFRGISILCVLLYHYSRVYRITVDTSFDPSLDFTYGYLGVQFFFIISGFVIWFTLNHSSSAGNFLFKRFSRLYPTFWFCVLLSFTVLYFFPLKNIDPVGIWAVIGNFTMIPGFLEIPRVDGAYWSLVPEFFFYIAMAVLFTFKKPGGWIYWGISIMTLSWINAFFPLHGKLHHLLNIIWGPLFFAGILFYKLKQQNKPFGVHLLILASFITTCLNLRGLEAKMVLGLIYLLFYLFVFGKINWIAWKPLIFIGRISFPLYLLHQEIGFVIMNHCKPYIKKQLLLMLVPVLLMILVAWAVHYLIELPSIRALRQWIGKRKVVEEENDNVVQQLINIPRQS